MSFCAIWVETTEKTGIMGITVGFAEQKTETQLTCAGKRGNLKWESDEEKEMK